MLTPKTKRSEENFAGQTRDTSPGSCYLANEKAEPSLTVGLMPRLPAENQGELRIIMKNVLRLLTVILMTALPAVAQQTTSDASRALSTADYGRAEKWMGYNTNPLVFRSGVRPAWQGDDRFWYRVTTPEGSEFIMVDTAKGNKAPAFGGDPVRSPLRHAQ